VKKRSLFFCPKGWGGMKNHFIILTRGGKRRGKEIPTMALLAGERRKRIKLGGNRQRIRSALRKGEGIGHEVYPICKCGGKKARASLLLDGWGKRRKKEEEALPFHFLSLLVKGKGGMSDARLVIKGGKGKKRR